MSTQGVIQVGDNRQFTVGDGQLVSGSVSLTEGKRASSCNLVVSDPEGALANNLPLVRLEEIPARRATVDVTFVVKASNKAEASVPAGVELATFVGDEKVLFRTDAPLAPSDFEEDGRTLQTLKQIEVGATVQATAVEAGPHGNIEAESLILNEQVEHVLKAVNKSPATGGRDAGIKGAKVPVDCWLGPGDDPTPPKLFSGYLSKLTAEHNQVKLMAIDKSADLRRKQRATSYNATDLESLVRRIAERHGFSVDLSQAELDGFSLVGHLQHGTTDWGFLHRQAEQVGHRVKVRGETLYVTKIGKTRERPNRPTFRPDDVSQYSFSVAELTTHTTPHITAVSGADASEYGDDTRAKLRPVQLSRTGVSSDYDAKPSNISQQEERQAQAEAREHRAFTGNITVPALYPQIDTDDQVILEGFGRRFDGPWWIESVTHNFDGQTSFSLTSDSNSNDD